VTVPSSDPLLRRLDTIEKLRSGLLDELAELPPDALTATPIPGKWSILQIVEHLVLAEQSAMSPPTGKGPLRPATLKNHLRRGIVMFVLRYDIPVKVPTESMVPLGGRSLAELGSTWETQRMMLRALLLSMDAETRGKPLALHAIAGPLTAAQSLLMLEVHLRRHIRQIRGRRKRLGV
jgi:hypothetical protein